MLGILVALANMNEPLDVAKSTSEKLIVGRLPANVDNCEPTLTVPGPGVEAVAILTCVQMFVPYRRFCVTGFVYLITSLRELPAPSATVKSPAVAAGFTTGAVGLVVRVTVGEGGKEIVPIDGSKIMPNTSF